MLTFTEKKIIRALIAHLATVGFTPTVEDVIAKIEETGEAHIFFSKNFKPHWVWLIAGNGEDIVSDYGVSQVDDGWNEAMDAFFDMGGVA